ncbi:MAG: hypothetical protein Q7J47_04800 [Azoarcus sp.]|nr:hypothetical protein [Azoarcus sp.]
MKDTGFWEKVFTELRAQNRPLLEKIRNSLKRTIEYLKGQKQTLRGFDTDRYIRDLEAVQQVAARTLLSAATRQKGEQSSRSSSVVRSEARDRVGPFSSEKMAEGSKAWHAKQGNQYNIEQADDGFYLTRTGAADRQKGQLDTGRCARAEVDAGASRQSARGGPAAVAVAQGDQRESGQGRNEAPVAGDVRRSAEGSVSLTAVISASSSACCDAAVV